MKKVFEFTELTSLTIQKKAYVDGQWERVMHFLQSEAQKEGTASAPTTLFSFLYKKALENQNGLV